jgi:hypothetical protein
MPVDPSELDRAYATLAGFGPELSLPLVERLARHFPELSPEQGREVLEQIERVTRTVWSLAERGGEARLGRDAVVNELRAAHAFLHDTGLKHAVLLVNYYAWHEGRER